MATVPMRGGPPPFDPSKSSPNVCSPQGIEGQGGRPRRRGAWCRRTWSYSSGSPPSSARWSLTSPAPVAPRAQRPCILRGRVSGCPGGSGAVDAILAAHRGLADTNVGVHLTSGGADASFVCLRWSKNRGHMHNDLSDLSGAATLRGMRRVDARRAFQPGACGRTYDQESEARSNPRRSRTSSSWHGEN